MRYAFRPAAGAIALWLLCACAPARLGRPAWLVAQRDADFPAERFWLAAAGGESAELAEQSARALLAEKIRKSLLTDHTASAGGCQAELSAEEESLLASLSPRILKTWKRSDGGLHAVLAGLERERVFELAKRALDLQREQVERLLDKAHRARSEGDLVAALRHALDACEKIERAAGLEKILAAVEKRTVPLHTAPLEFENLGQELSRLELKVIKGDMQPRLPDGTLAGEVLLGAYQLADDTRLPLAGAPLLLEPPAPAPPVTCVTSELGVCSVLPQGLPLLPQPRGKITASLHAEALLSADSSCLQKKCLDSFIVRRPSVEFSFLAAPASAERAMVLLEGRGGKVRLALLDLFQRHLEAALADRGLGLVARQAAAEDLAMTESLEEAPEAVRKVTDWLVSGGVATMVSRQVADTLQFCQAQAWLRLIRVADGSVKLEIERRHQAAGRDKESACRRAAEALARECAQEIGGFFSKGAEKP